MNEQANDGCNAETMEQHNLANTGCVMRPVGSGDLSVSPDAMRWTPDGSERETIPWRGGRAV